MQQQRRLLVLSCPVWVLLRRMGHPSYMNPHAPENGTGRIMKAV
ncbi:hypothetical protein ASZ90_010871 [hydrocarbon metagenome]|uniref:Uncharacterized protein n=1 Tax=hydrocarbon metagenome TaxID=938273 RepID=A0A0W8FFK6_9ZZZZ